MAVSAALQSDHAAIYSLVAKHNKCIRDFSNTQMFSSQSAYEKGWIRVGLEVERPNYLLGFTCVRHKVRLPVTELYFIGTRPGEEGRGVAQGLLLDLMQASPHRRIELNVVKENERAVTLYDKFGFVIVGEGLGGKAHRMRLTW